MNKQAFTLVELVIVIIILGVLSSIGFVSYTNYISGSRDANRVTQIKDIYKGLQLYTTTNKLPYPDTYVTITASGTTVGYQGNAGVEILKTIGYSNGGQDPKDKTYFTYYASKDRKRLQVMGFLEEKDNLETQLAQFPLIQTHAASYVGRYPKNIGTQQGIILDSITQSPIQNSMSGTLDVVTSGSTYKVIFSDTNSFTASGSKLLSLNPLYNCERLQQIGKMQGNGYYTIKPGGIGYKIYCDSATIGKNLMEVNWTLGSGALGNFALNGTVPKNQRILYQTPMGFTDIVWQAVPDGTNSSDGGWNYTGIPIDNTKTYRVSVWMKKTGSINGTSYLGTTVGSGIKNLNNTANGNPYFWAADLPNLDQWYLLVGYIHGSGDNSMTSYGGIYNMVDGNKDISITDFKFDISATVATHRSYLYYDITSTNRQYFYDPKFEEIEAAAMGDVKDLLPIAQ